MDKNRRQSEYNALCRKRDIAAYSIVGAARAIFSAFPLPEGVAKLAGEAIEEFDRANKAVTEFDWEEPK